MKRFLLVCGLLALIACTKDQTEIAAGGGEERGAIIIGEPTLAVKGHFNVKLTPEAAAKVAEAQKTTRGDEQTRSGLIDIDQILAEIGAMNFERMVEYDAAWESLYTETGMNLWYKVDFDEQVVMDKAAAMLAAQPGISVLEYSLQPQYLKGQHVGPAKPFKGDAENLSTRATSAMNDPMLSYQWHYDNTGSYGTFPRQPVAGADINLFDAWKLCAGNSSVIVAVIDQAVYTEHPDLKDNMWSNPSNPNEHGWNFFNNRAALDWKSFTTEIISGRTYYNYTDHGSHVAGIIAAVNNNGKGVSGIAGGKNGGSVKIMSCQTLGNDPVGYEAGGDVRAFNYAMKNGAIIAQNSWGFNYSGNTTPAAIAREWETGSQFSSLKTAMQTFIRGAGSQNPNSPLKGGLIVFAAGNDGDIFRDAKIYPAAYEPVIAVGSTGWDFRPAYYTDYGNWVDISAPGGDSYSSGNAARDYGAVLSAILCDNTIDYKDGRSKTDPFYGYGFMQGTSMACPHVSGVAALGLSYAAQLGKQYTPQEFRALLLSSVSGIDQYFTGSATAVPSFEVYKGKMGGGCVDALKLLLAIKGTPAIYVKTGAAATIDFAKHFGGSATKVQMLSASSGELANIGASGLPAFKGSTLTITCTKAGVATVIIKAMAGDTMISREFAIVSRAGLADNGGWL